MHIEYILLIFIGSMLTQLVNAFYIIKMFSLRFKLKAVVWSYMLLIGLTGSIAYVYNVYEPFRYRGLIASIATIVFCLIISNDKIKNRIIGVTVYFLLSLMSDLVCLVVMNLAVGPLNMTEEYMSISVYVFTAIFAVLVMIFLKFYKKPNVNSKKNHIGLFFPFIVIQLIFLVAVFLLMQSKNEEVFIYYVTALLVLLVCMDMLLYYNTKEFVKRELLEFKYKQLEDQRNSEYGYIMDQVKNNEKYRKFNHDMRNNLTIISRLLREDQNDAGLNMLKDVADEAVSLEKRRFSNNPAIDALLTFKKKIADKNDIKFDAKFSFGTELKITDIDLCSILSGLIDNAVDICTAAQKSEARWIECSGSMNQGVLLIKVMNGNGSPGNEFGTRFDVIRDILKPYSGTVEVDQAEDRFQTCVFIPVQN